MILTPSRYKHFAAMALIGDGVMAVVQPARDAEAWNGGPRPWCRLMEFLAQHPTLTRTIGAVQIAGGVWWALHEGRKL